MADNSVLIDELVRYGEKNGLVAAEDRVYVINRLLEILQLDEYQTPEQETPVRPVHEILADLMENAYSRGVMTENSVVYQDLFDTKLMGALVPAPSTVIRKFRELYEESPKAATNYYYKLSCDTNYIRRDRIKRDVKWTADTEYGTLDITINLSKPEKDPKEIAKLKNAPSVGYPKCMLCVENPGYRGRSNFPARQNHRMVPLSLAGQTWYLQYSPYAYYPEHCIVLNSQHVPMRISRGTFDRLFDFVQQFPHYMLGSNADLPIVGGSILNHDHFQGGRYHFPMDDAKVRCQLKSPVTGVSAALLDWPMSTIQLSGTDEQTLIAEASRILDAWRGYSDEACGIFAETDGTPHNTITPILRKEGEQYRLNLVLRNNRTSEEHPLGIFHPHAPLHHIKKENIGLIEVMGLFILPGRLKTELAALNGYLTGEKPLVRPAESDPCAKHYDWLVEVVARHGLVQTSAEAEAILRQEVALVCAQVLADAGVYKRDEAGVAGFQRFMKTLGYEA